MNPRRSFFGIIFRLTAGFVLWLNPAVSFIRRAYAESKRIILPKGTKMTSLVDKNPAELDTRNLEVIPLRVVAEDYYGAEWVKFVHEVEAFKVES